MIDISNTQVFDLWPLPYCVQLLVAYGAPALFFQQTHTPVLFATVLFLVFVDAHGFVGLDGSRTTGGNVSGGHSLTARPPKHPTARLLARPTPGRGAHRALYGI